MSETTRASFTEDLVNESGAAERNPYAQTSGNYKFLRLGFSFCQARIKVQEASNQRNAVLRLRSLQMSERLEMVRALSWHQRYVLRERAKQLLQMLKQTSEGSVLRDKISYEISRYKTKSDQLLSARHRGVHEYESHHPLLRQLDTLELLSGDAVKDRNFAAVMEMQRSQVARRASKTLALELKNEEMTLLQLTDAAFETIYGLSEHWSFAD
ncbi:MAG: hypothetical protein ACK4MY_13785 [Brevundimonas sp.]